MILGSLFESFDAHDLVVRILQRPDPRRPGDWLWGFLVQVNGCTTVTYQDHILSLELVRAAGELAARTYAQLRDRTELVRLDVEALSR